LAVDRVVLGLARVVRDVVQHDEPRLRQHAPERLAGQMRDDLPIREGAVGRRGHRAEIGLAERRAYRRARELSIGQAYAVLLRRGRHLAQELRADLMPQAAGAAMNRREDRAALELESGRDLLGGELRDVLDLEVVVARAERPPLIALAPACTLRDVLGDRARHAAALLDALEVIGLAVALLDGPAGSAGEHRGHLLVVRSEEHTSELQSRENLVC